MIKSKPDDFSQKDFEKALDEIKSSGLSPKTKYLLLTMMTFYAQMVTQLQNSRLTIIKLKNLIFGPKTEKKKKNPKKPEGKNSSSSDKKEPPKHSEGKKPKGHGRKPADEYPGAERVSVTHADHCPGDLCPECGRGRLSELEPAKELRFLGQAPITAKLYELQRLRCNACQFVFKAALPTEAGPDRKTPSSNAMVALLHFGAGMPYYRLEGLQSMAGVPLPDSSQWNMVEAVHEVVKCVFHFLFLRAAQATRFFHDDSKVRVLELMKENKETAVKRKGLQTTGIVAEVEGRKIALFFSGRDHAGENLQMVMEHRDQGLAPPQQVADALSCNFTVEFITILIKCVDHGRRQFKDIETSFEGPCGHVIEELARVYYNDAQAKRLGLTDQERLEYHQTHSRLIMNSLNEWMHEQIESRRVEPNNALGGAIKYWIKHWNELTQFLRVPGAPLSNAEVERLLKRCILRRKNSYFYKTRRSAAIGDAMMSVIETARFAGANVFHYLTQIQIHASKLQAEPEKWMPWNYLQNLEASQP